MRSASLARMCTMLHYDEAYHAMDALNVMREPRLTPFFPGNFGRESGFVYWALPFVAALPGHPLAMRLAAVLLSVLTLAAAARLARELIGPWGAVWTLAALNVLYWHVHISQLALRANLYVTIGTLAAAWLVQASRTRKMEHWVAAGIAIGLLGYTYFTSLIWMGMFGLMLIAWMTFDPARRRGALLAGISAGAIFLPMICYVMRHPEHVLGRPTTVGALNRELLLHNLRVWSRAWFQVGDLNRTFNLPGRPIFGPLLGGLAIFGVIALFILVRRRWYALWLLGLGAVALLPSLLSNQAPHFLRAVGVTVPLAVVIGAGATGISRLAVYGAERGVLALWNMTLDSSAFLRMCSIGLALLPLIVLVPAGWQTYRDFHQQWLTHPDTFKLMEEPLNRSVDFITTMPEDTSRVYFSPYQPTHPVIVYRGLTLAPRPVGAFDSHQCLVAPGTGAAIYVSMTAFEPSFETRLSQWLKTEVLLTYNNEAHYTIFRAEFRADALSTASPDYEFNDSVVLRSLHALPELAQAGEILPLALSVQPLKRIDQPLSIFVHVYGDPLPQDGGKLWAQADSQICATYPVQLWTPEEVIIQPYDLTLPPDLPAGTYTIAVGIYLYPNGARLPVMGPASQEGDWVALHTFTIP